MVCAGFGLAYQAVANLDHQLLEPLWSPPCDVAQALVLQARQPVFAIACSPFVVPSASAAQFGAHGADGLALGHQANGFQASAPLAAADEGET